MKLKNGEEIEVGKLRYRVILDELFLLREGEPPLPITTPTFIMPDSNPCCPLSPDLIAFYEKKGYDVCPSCGQDRKSPASTGCPAGSHYGTYCSIPA